jgi:hypothetical protein
MSDQHAALQNASAQLLAGMTGQKFLPYSQLISDGVPNPD